MLMDPMSSSKIRTSNHMVIVGANNGGYGATSGVRNTATVYPFEGTNQHRYSKSMPDHSPLPAVITTVPRQASSPACSNTSRVFFADNWKYKTTVDRSPRVRAPQTVPRSATPPNPVRGGSSTTALQLHRPAIVTSPNSREITPVTSTLPKSPFTRGRSRVFYASDAMHWDERENDDGLVAPPYRKTPFEGSHHPVITPISKQATPSSTSAIKVLPTFTKSSAPVFGSPSNTNTFNNRTPNGNTLNIVSPKSFVPINISKTTTTSPVNRLADTNTPNKESFISANKSTTTNLSVNGSIISVNRSPSKPIPVNGSTVIHSGGATIISISGSPINSVNGSEPPSPIVRPSPTFPIKMAKQLEAPRHQSTVASSAPAATGISVLPGTPHFRRSARHRGSSGRKSLDSGFSDSGGEVTSSGPEDATHCAPITRPDHPVMPLKSTPHHHKWSPASLTIKSFLRASSHGPTGTTTTPKLSVLKCCMGRAGNPAGLLSALTGHRSIQHDKTDRFAKSTSEAVVPASGTDIRAQDSIVNDASTVDAAKSGSNTGTWPRLRKHQRHLSEAEVVPNVQQSTNGVLAPPQMSAVHPGGVRFLSGSGTKAYKSTRCRETPRIDGRDEELRNKSGVKFGKRIIDSSAVLRNSSLTNWLHELPSATEDECTNTLQNKSVARTDGEVIAMATRNSRDVVLAIHARANSIMTDLAKLKRKLDKKRYQGAHSICIRLSRHIHALLCDCERHHSNNGHLVNQFHRLILAHLGILIQLLSRLHEGTAENGETNSVFDVYCAIKSTFLNVTETLIVAHIKNVVDALEEPLCVFSMRIAVMSVSVLGLQDNDICRLISASGGIRALLAVCIDRRYRPVWATALRALATLCCVSESIREMEMSGGVECITEILSDLSGSHEEKCEAAGVVAQITSPAMENSHRIQGLEDNIPSLMQSLTDLAGNTNSSDGFLLATAAIANLTFLSDFSALVHRCRTVSVLVESCRHGCAKSDSIFVKDQVATVLANQASHAAGRADVLNSGGLVVLLCFLQTRPNVPGSSPEGAAAERVQQKSAIALSRLCCDPVIAKQVVSLQGIQRLVKLCKDERERNGSDAVLVACLAVLRKVASACGFEKFKDLDAMELVEPRLLDTFLIYSSRQESFV